MKHYEDCLWSKGDFLATVKYFEGDDDDITIKRTFAKMLFAKFYAVSLICV